MSNLMDTRLIHIGNMPEVVTQIPRPLDMNPAAVYLASLSAKSGRRTQQQVLGVVAGWLGGSLDTIEWGALRYAHTAAIKTMILENGYSAASARKILSALRGTLKAAWRLGQLNADDYAKATDLGKVSGTSLPVGRYINDEELAALFAVCRETKGIAGRRDAAIIAVLAGCGLRREEIVNVDLSDYNREDGTLVVHGKRRKTRVAYVVNGTAEALNDWIEIRSVRPGPLFLAISKEGRIRHERRLSSQAIYDIFTDRVKEAGIEKCSPHSLRRTFCSRLLDADVDVITVSKMAGHENVQTTAIYDRRPQEVQRVSAEKVTIPYQRRGTITPQEPQEA